MVGFQQKGIRLLLGLLCMNSFFAHAQQASSLQLSSDEAARFSSIVLHCANEEYPNKAGHISESATTNEHYSALHPAFHGCFDWHSDVHGHWMLVKLLQTYPQIANADSIRKQLENDLSAEKIQGEAAYYSNFKLAKNYERPYGWAWLLKLDEALLSWKNNPQAQHWHQNLQPLAAVIRKTWMDFLPNQHYPDRSGMHSNTAFSLTLALDYARIAKDTTFENLIVSRSKDYFLQDKNIPSSWEPNATDFLSPSLEEADLMRRVLPKKDFAKWFHQFYSTQTLHHLYETPVITDPSDYMLVHLIGLGLSRAWCFQAIANALGSFDKEYQPLMNAAKKHMATMLPYVYASNYGGQHWLATFSVYALTEK